MKSVDQPPKASTILTSMRSIGYSFEAAAADIFDNSLAASSTTLCLEFRKDPVFVAFIDDGYGMCASTLVEAMRLGSSSPLHERALTDHGRFGLGLKTASLSQCRRLTVVSKRDGVVCAARWDLDEIERTDSWSLLLLEPEEFERAPCFDKFNQQRSGTLVVWEDFDRLGTLKGESDNAEILVGLISETTEYLSLIFHRMMDGSAPHQIAIYVNGMPLSPADPFFKRNSYTRVVGRQSQLIDGKPISAIAYILPRLNQTSKSELQAAGGATRMRDMQGFFVYRNFRLVTFGTWFRLASREELTRLARIQVDIDNTSDDLWHLDIKKASVYPSLQARHFLSRMVKYVSDESMRRFKPRVSVAQVAENVALWLRVSSQGMIHFKINRAHPLVSASLSSSVCGNQPIVALLDALELSLPIKQLYFDQAQNENVTYDDAGAEERLQFIFDILTNGLPEKERVELVADLPYLEPFRSHPAITAKLKEG